MTRDAIAAGLAAVLVGACATLPSGPSMLVLPGTGKSFEVFQADDAACRQYAQQRLGTTAQQAAADAGVKSAAVGTVIGAAAGAAIDDGHGAAIGAGTGLAVGALAGAGDADLSAHEAQRRYDHGYQQCMYAKGHRVPVYGNFVSQGGHTGAGVPPPPTGLPPPPPSGTLR